MAVSVRKRATSRSLCVLRLAGLTDAYRLAAYCTVCHRERNLGREVFLERYGPETLTTENGKVLHRKKGELGYGEVYGTSFANGKVYAFTSNGEVIEVDPATGNGTLVKTHADVSFWGAAVTPLVSVE